MRTKEEFVLVFAASRLHPPFCCGELCLCEKLPGSSFFFSEKEVASRIGGISIASLTSSRHRAIYTCLAIKLTNRNERGGCWKGRSLVPEPGFFFLLCGLWNNEEYPLAWHCLY